MVGVVGKFPPPDKNKRRRFRLKKNKEHSRKSVIHSHVTQSARGIQKNFIKDSF